METDGAIHGGVTTFGEFLSGLDFNTGTQRPLSQVAPEVIEIGNQCSRVDFFFHGIVAGQETVEEMPMLAREYGIYSYKHFFNSYKAKPGEAALLPSTENDQLFKSLRQIAAIGEPAVGMGHCEDQDIAWVLEDQLKAQGRNDLLAWTEHRPNWAEEMRMQMAFNIAKAAGAPFYCVHMASAEGPDIIKQLRSEGYVAWGETCPHYLTHTGDMEEQIGVWGKVNTTLKTTRDIDRLWRGIVDGSVTNMGTDHCPWPKAAKENGGGKHNNIWNAMPGINGGMEHWLPVMMTFGVNPGRISIEDMVRVCSTNNAKVWGLYPKKGVLAPGSDADIVLVDPDKEATIDENFYHCMADWGIYFGWKVRGMARTTIVRGNVMMEDYKTVGEPGIGKYQPCGPAGR
jgi:dihydropyrimidinase/dihydroorotase